MLPLEAQSEGLETHQFVFLSVIYGAAVASLAGGSARLIVDRNRIRGWWLSWVWIAIVGLQIAQNWWVMWTWRELVIRDFLGFLVVGGIPVCYCFIAPLLVPPSIPDRGFDLRAHYFEHRRPAFLIIATVVALLQVVDWMMSGIGALDLNEAIRGGAIVAILSLAVSRSVNVHAAVSFLLLAASVAWIGMLTFTLPA